MIVQSSSIIFFFNGIEYNIFSPQESTNESGLSSCHIRRIEWTCNEYEKLLYFFLSKYLQSFYSTFFSIFHKRIMVDIIYIYFTHNMFDSLSVFIYNNQSKLCISNRNWLTWLRFFLVCQFYFFLIYLWKCYYW